MFKMSIPQISDEEILKRYEHIKPVITVNDKLYHFKEFTLDEIRNISYIWNYVEDIREEVTADELEIIPGQDFICLHTYAYYGLFKPSIAEVLSQIDDSIIGAVAAFEIISDYPLPDSLCYIAAKNSLHVSMVRLYRKSRF